MWLRVCTPEPKPKSTTKSATASCRPESQTCVKGVHVCIHRPLNSCLPAVFQEFLDYCRCLHFEDKPDYSQLRRMFRDRFFQEGFSPDFTFDWTIKNYVSAVHRQPALHHCLQSEKQKIARSISGGSVGDPAANENAQAAEAQLTSLNAGMEELAM